MTRLNTIAVVVCLVSATSATDVEAQSPKDTALAAVESVLTIDPDNKTARYQQARISQMLEQRP